MRDKFIEISLNDLIAKDILYQHDKGQVVRFVEEIGDGTLVLFNNSNIKEDAVPRYVENCSVEIPDRLLETEGSLVVTVKLVDSNSETTQKVVKIKIKSGSKQNEEIEPENQQTFIEQIQDIMTTTKAIAEGVQERADNGEFNGRDGADGYTPVKGTDYFTDAEVNQIKNDTREQVVTEITPSLENNLKSAKDYTDNAIIRDFKDITYDETTATFIFTRHDDTTFTVDLPIEQTVKDGRYDDETAELVLVLVSGQEIRIPVSGLIDDYIGVDSATIQVVISADNKITCNIIGGTISKTLLTTELQEEIDGKANRSEMSNLVQEVGGKLLELATTDKDSYVTAINELKGDLVNVSNDVITLRAQSGIFANESDIVGLQVDYKNKTFTRLAGAVNLTAGADFDKFSMYGGRKRCNVLDDGTITAFYGDDNYVEDGSNGQVMVYQPKFYYLVCPLEYDKQETGIGYHLRKANYYVSEKAREGFKLHPAFYDKNGNECDYILMSAFEGTIYDASASAYLKNDEQVADFNNDKFASVAGGRPASGLSQRLTRPNVEKLAQNRGEDWHSLGIKAASMEQMLMIIEMGMMNLQTAIGKGVVSITDDSSQSCASFTGSTVGNGTGEATSSKDYAGTVQTASGKKSICYRGVENFWGNIWKFVYGVNIWGNGKMQGGQPFICSDFNYAESKNSGNYEAAGFCMTNASGYISAMGYSTKYDWLFMASECLGNSSLPVGDYTYTTPDLNGYRLTRLGGYWYADTYVGGFYWDVNNGVGVRYRSVGGRLVYVPITTA